MIEQIKTHIHSLTNCFIKRQSFIDQHFTSFSFFLPCNNEEFVLFEDLTDNHNKATINALAFNTLPCAATLIVETRDGMRITRELRPGQNAVFIQRSLLVEDLRRVIIRCSGDPTGRCQGFVTVVKTFCISCGNKMRLSSESCFADQHSGFINYQLPCNSPSLKVYENLTPNHNKAYVQIQNFSPDCTVTLEIKTKDETIVESFDAFANRAFQVEDLKNVSVLCTGEIEGLCSGNIFIQNSFCICCDNKKF